MDIFKGKNEKVAAWKVKSYEPMEKEQEEKGEVESVKKDVNFYEEESNSRSSVWNCSSEEDDLVEKRKDTIGDYYVRMTNSDYFDESSVFVVEVPILRHKEL